MVASRAPWGGGKEKERKRKERQLPASSASPASAASAAQPAQPAQPGLASQPTPANPASQQTRPVSRDKSQKTPFGEGAVFKRLRHLFQLALGGGRGGSPSALRSS